jgi:hypothetical protein
MSKLEFEQKQVVAAAGRAWHKREPAIIQQDGFPIASIVFVRQSPNSFTGYGVMMDFQITDSTGRPYLAQIHKDMIVAAAESQFPGDFDEVPAANNPFNLIPAEIQQVKQPEMHPVMQMMRDVSAFNDSPEELNVATGDAVLQEQAEAAPESYSKRLRRDVKELIAGTLPNHGIFKTGLNLGTTVVWHKPTESNFVYISTATASNKDTQKDAVGARIAYRRLKDGRFISLPTIANVSPEQQLGIFFGRSLRAEQDAIWKEYKAKTDALREEFKKKGLDV